MIHFRKKVGALVRVFALQPCELKALSHLLPAFQLPMSSLPRALERHGCQQVKVSCWSIREASPRKRFVRGLASPLETMVLRRLQLADGRLCGVSPSNQQCRTSIPVAAARRRIPSASQRRAKRGQQ